MSGMFFSGFLFISTHILLDLLSVGSAKAYTGWVGKLNSHLMSGCVRNIRIKNYQNLIIGFQVTAKNVGDMFFLGHSVYAGLNTRKILFKTKKSQHIFKTNDTGKISSKWEQGSWGPHRLKDLKRAVSSPNKVQAEALATNTFFSKETYATVGIIW